MSTADGSGHAIVLGASLAGLLTAAALARHLDKVTIVERDRLPDGPEWRRGVPQSRHAHNLMTAGHDAMEQLFPGVRQELQDAGMVKVRMPEDMLLLTAGGWMPRFSSGLFMLTSSRDVIDYVIRRRVAANPRITFLTETEALGLVSSDDNSTVLGVNVRDRGDGKDAEPYALPAEFVVDATGRTSRTPDWLAEMGYDRPADSVVDAQTAYSTCVFEPPAGHNADWNCILLQYAPNLPRQGIINPIENGRWMVSLAALGKDRPPRDMDGFLEYARSLRSPVIYDALRDATPVTSISQSGRTENRWRHYEKLRRWPDRFLVIGDAIGAFNPSYGQGMSVAARSALALDATLEKAKTTQGIAARLRRDVAKCINMAWAVAATGDLAYPWSSDHVSRAAKMQLGYLYRVIGACPRSESASRALLDINQLVAAPQALARPRVLAAAFRGRPKIGAPAGPPPVLVDPAARPARQAA